MLTIHNRGEMIGRIATRSRECRKKITAVFADLVGSTALAERLAAVSSTA
jgi:class 3 adenylate cyclase